MAQATESQNHVLAFLADPATHGGSPVTRIDTHAAAVFLAGDRALKVKRAVRFPFLDYSTLEKRKTACETELEINRRFAPDIYRRVVAITRRDDGALELGGNGAVVEWALDMRRFDETATLDHLADAGKIDLTLADTLGRVIAAAHADAPVADAARWIDALGQYIDQNKAAFAEFPDLFSKHDAEGLTDMSRAAYAKLQPLLHRRGNETLIRRAHGDLHLGNIVMIDGKPVLFDAVEFDPVVASGDVLYDLAFVLMDLAERGLQPSANALFNRYLIETARDSDLDTLTALPLFLSLRAAIRAKVTAARLDNAKPENADAIRKAAKSYFALALHLIAPPPPRLIAVGGLSGTGKSVLARALAPELAPAPGAVVLRSDILRKRMFNRAETETLPQEAYTPEVTERLYGLLIDKARRAIAAGHSVIVDAVFARQAERDALVHLAQSGQVRFTGLFLTADLATRIERVGGRIGDASDADQTVAQRQEGYDLGPLEWTQIDASSTPEETLGRAKAAIA
jgi:aminoglycoside phosphotransferase family enzyme/predicted kinase